MDSWIGIVESPGQLFGEDSVLRPYPIDWASELDHLLASYSKVYEWGEALEVLVGLRGSAYLFEDKRIAPAIVIAPNEGIYIKKIFHSTLVDRTQQEFHTYLLGVLLLQMKGGLGCDEDLLIDVHQSLAEFMSHRKSHLDKEEVECLYPVALPTECVRPLVLVGLMHYGRADKVSLLETKLVRDHLGASKTKRLLGLGEDDYKYLEESPQWDRTDPEVIERVYAIEREISRRKIDFLEYTQERLLKRKMLFWCWWTISPFVSLDTSTLLPLLSEVKNIKRLYIDLCMDSESTYQNYVMGRFVSQEQLEGEIKKIYPPILRDCQKEIFPYQLILEKLRDLRIPIKCFGMSGSDLINTEPFLRADNHIEYQMNRAWKKAIYKEYQKLDQLGDDDLIIYIYFMKPMFVLPSFEDERVEKVIHIDRFTGFGTKKPENSIALYSRYGASEPNSFVYPGIKKSSFKDENIVHLPFVHEELPRLDQSKFNRFHLYDTMVYSGKRDDRGNGDKAVNLPDFAFQFSH